MGQEKKMREKQDWFGLFESMVRFVLPHWRILFLPFFRSEVDCVFCRWSASNIGAAESSWWMDFLMFKVFNRQMPAGERTDLINGTRLLSTPGWFEYTLCAHPCYIQLLAPFAFTQLKLAAGKCLGFSLSLVKMYRACKLLQRFHFKIIKNLSSICLRRGESWS